MSDYFKFKGIDSRNMGVRVMKFPPRKRAPERLKSETIPGRHGTLTLIGGKTATYDSYKQTIEAVLLPSADIASVASWLSESGDLICSYDLTKKQQVRITEGIDFEKIMRNYKHRKFSITMECQPFLYSADQAADKKTITAAATIQNPGTEISQPIITVRGSGDIELYINAQVIDLSSVSSYITINSVMKDAYKGLALANNQMSGELPYFPVGSNMISWDGSVTQLEIEPNWRWR